MRIVTINTKRTTVKETFKEAPETHYIGIYNPAGQYTIGFLDKDEALKRAKSLIPMINKVRNNGDSKRKGIQGSTRTC